MSKRRERPSASGRSCWRQIIAALTVLLSVALLPPVAGPAGADSVSSSVNTTFGAAALDSDGTLGFAQTSFVEGRHRVEFTTVDANLTVQRSLGPSYDTAPEIEIAYDSPTSSWLLMLNFDASGPVLVALSRGQWRQAALPVPSLPAMASRTSALFSDRSDPTHVIVSRELQSDDDLERDASDEPERRHWFATIDAAAVDAGPMRELPLGDGSVDPVAVDASIQLDDGRHALFVAPSRSRGEIRRYAADFSSYELVGTRPLGGAIEVSRADSGYVLRWVDGVAGVVGSVLDGELKETQRLLGRGLEHRTPALSDPDILTAGATGAVPVVSTLDLRDLERPARIYLASSTNGTGPGRVAASTFLGNVLVAVDEYGGVSTTSPRPWTIDTLPASTIGGTSSQYSEPAWEIGERHTLSTLGGLTTSGTSAFYVGSDPSVRLGADCALQAGYVVEIDGVPDHVLPHSVLATPTGPVVTIRSFDRFGAVHISGSETATFPSPADGRIPVTAASTHPDHPTFATAWLQGATIIVRIVTTAGALVGHATVPVDFPSDGGTATALEYDEGRNRYVLAVEDRNGTRVATIDGSTATVVGGPSVYGFESSLWLGFAVDPDTGAAAFNGSGVTVLQPGGTFVTHDVGAARIVSDAPNGRFVGVTYSGGELVISSIRADGTGAANDILRKPISGAFGFMYLIYDADAERGLALFAGGIDTHLIPFGSSTGCDLTPPTDPPQTLRLAAPAQDATPITELPAAAGASSGYWLLDAGGGVVGFGGAGAFDRAPGSENYVDFAATPDGRGYWMLTSSGRVYTAGTAQHHGHLSPEQCCAAQIAARPDRPGYWIFGTAGEVWTFGEAEHFGDLSLIELDGGIVDAVVTPTGQGYYLLGADGGVFTFGDAEFRGSVRGVTNEPVDARSIVPSPSGGYWIIGDDGGVFAFDAPFRGSVPGALNGGRPDAPVVGGVAYGNGYLLMGTDGGVFNFSDLPFNGSLGGQGISGIVAVQPLPVS